MTIINVPIACPECGEVSIYCLSDAVVLEPLPCLALNNDCQHQFTADEIRDAYPDPE